MGVGSGRVPQTSNDTMYGTNPAGEGSPFNDGDTGPGSGEPGGPRTEGVQTPDHNTPPRSGASDEVHVGTALGGDKVD